MTDPAAPPPPEGFGYPPPRDHSGGWSPPPPPPPGYGAGYGPAVGYGSGAGAPADLGMRFLARLIDWVILFVVNIVITVVVFAAVAGSDLTGMGVTYGGHWGATALLSLVQAVIYLGYFSLLESRNGQTVGKLALRLRTQTVDGGTPTLQQAAKRNIFMVYPIFGVVPFLGFVGSLAALVALIMVAVTISQSPVREGWHDRFARTTRVVKVA